MMSPRGVTRTVRVSRRRDGEWASARDALAVEEPLEMRVAWTAPEGPRVEALAVTMRTPGDDFELMAGFLHGEGVVSRADDLVELTYCRSGELQEYNVVEARLSRGVSVDLARVRRNVYTTSSCGVCGKASLEAVDGSGCVPVSRGLRVDARLVGRLPDRLLTGQRMFAKTGGLHAAGLFERDGEPRSVREDVGRHNAVDKVVGRSLLDRGLPAGECILVVSGRASFEIVQKAVMAGIPIVVAVGAPSSLAVQLAKRFDQTLVGFARDGGFNVYCGKERIA
jgi:FdhD protein